MSSVSTYLNFPDKTEEAFHFYKTVFGGDFDGGIHRFRDMPQEEGQPPISDDVKDLVLHVSLPIMGGSHVLMGSDAPEQFGFTVNYGNNVYISLQTDSRKETERLFEALSAGGKVTMQLQDMFWGAYFGSCTDRYGVQWMVNCEEKPSE